MRGCNLAETGVRSILRVSFPMMISAFSSHMMLVLDQLVLAHYSIDAMAGASGASLWGSVLTCSISSITMIAGVFAGHYNGANKQKLSGIPVWQMVWFSIAMFILSYPIATSVGPYCIPQELQLDGLPYFKCIVSFAPLVGIIYALSSYFTSIGKGYLITIAAIASNIINLGADITLVFGFLGFDQFTGSIGAAIGTIISYVANIVILLCFFFKREMIEKYGTLNFKLRLGMLKKCLILAVPGGVGHIFEMSSWCFLYYILASALGKEMAVIQAMAVSVNLLLNFAASGLEKGIMAITSNCLGAQQLQRIKPILKSGVLAHLVFAAILFPMFYMFPEIIIDRFIRFSMSPEIIDKAYLILKLVWIFFLFDGICWVIAGIVESGGDLRYMMWTFAISAWLIVTIPSLIMYKFFTIKIETIWILLIVSVILTTVVLFYRYKSEKWIKIRV